MTVCIVKPEGTAEFAEVENTLEALQKIVDGYIEPIPMDPRTVMIVNEEGKLRQLPPNFLFSGDLIRGNVVICGVDGEEFCSLSEQSKKNLEATFARRLRRCCCD